MKRERKKKEKEKKKNKKEEESINNWLQEIGINEQAKEYANKLSAQGYETLDQLLRYPPTDLQLEKYGISKGLHRNQILLNFTKLQGMYFFFGFQSIKR